MNQRELRIGDRERAGWKAAGKILSQRATHVVPIDPDACRQGAGMEFVHQPVPVEEHGVVLERHRAQILAQRVPSHQARVDHLGRFRTEEHGLPLDTSGYVEDGGEVVESYPVAVGTKKHPTPRGSFAVRRVIWNPRWIPPTYESWAEDEERKAPGAPDNPLGRVQLVYDPPRTIHGTNEPSSIGKAVSHGSIRMRNDDAIALAKRLMESAGVGKDEAWYSRVQQNRTEKQIVDLPGGVPITVK